jgi:hypothetical protein
MDWAALWALFQKTHLVTLPARSSAEQVVSGFRDKAAKRDGYVTIGWTPQSFSLEGRKFAVFQNGRSDFVGTILLR